jgi:hypothetical protein
MTVGKLKTLLADCADEDEIRIAEQGQLEIIHDVCGYKSVKVSFRLPLPDLEEALVAVEAYPYINIKYNSI